MNIEAIKKLFAFSWSQAFSDQNGKSSIFPVCCFMGVTTGCIGFIYSVYIKDVNLAMWSTTMVTVSLGALTGRKIINGKPGELPKVEEQTAEQ